MDFRTIKKAIVINAPKNKVWDALIKDNLTRTWYAEFSEGAFAVTDWKEGSKVVFQDPNGDGMIGKIEVSKPNEKLSVEYNGLLAKGVEDYDSQVARALKGKHENYLLSAKGAVTHLSIEADMSLDYFDSMSKAWDKALIKIKELCEN